MTVVLQRQFWDLAVDADAFSVTLRFDRRPARLRVPFAAVRSFADPAASFGLEFGVSDESPGDAQGSADGEGEQAPGVAEVVELDSFRTRKDP
jgi:hypothetical protein